MSDEARMVEVEFTPPLPGEGAEVSGSGPEATLTLSPVPPSPERIWLMEIGTGRWHRVESLPCDLGREAGVAIRLDGDRTVSRRHARLHRRPAGVVIEDLGSAAGVRVNGHPVREVLLAHQDVVTLGATTLIVQFGSPAEGHPAQEREGGRSGRRWLAGAVALLLLLSLGGALLHRSSTSPPAVQEERAARPPEGGAVERVDSPVAPPAPDEARTVASGPPPPASAAEKGPPPARGGGERRSRPAPVPVEAKRLDGEERIGEARRRYLAGEEQAAAGLLEAMAGSSRYPAAVRSRARRLLGALRRLSSAYRSGLAAWEAGRTEEGFDAWIGFLRAEERLFPGERSRWAEGVRERVVAELSRRGREAAEAGRQYDAYRYWQQAERIDPASEGARLLSGREREAKALYRHGYRLETVDLRRALEYWNRVVRLVPPDSEYHIKAAAKIRWYAYLEER